jgi:hypothetical protein
LAVGLAAAGTPRDTAAASGIQFVDVTAKAGIRFTHNSGRTGKKWLPETMGSGVVVFDADGDHWPDVLLLNSKDLIPRGRRTISALYRNNRNGTFTDVTRGSGLEAEMYALGGAAADYDNDGREDLYVTALEGDRLFHNEGGGRFRDVTKTSGISNANFGSSAAWVDYDRDGRADLAVANYVQWTAKGDLWCSLDGQTKSYCTPESYKGTQSKLYRNLGGGRFEDATEKAGLGDKTSKALGIATIDFDGNGWPDLFFANDTQPNKLYKNNGNGTFTEVGVTAGVAYGEDGVARGAMGVDFADYDRSGRQHLIVGNFSNQMLGLYHNEGRDLFVDEAPRSPVGRASLLSLCFGVFFYDYDLDGMLDILAANGHIDEEIGRVQPKIQFRQPPLLFRNVGGGRFADMSKAVGSEFQRSIVARGAAYLDYDGDGDLDAIVSTNHGPTHLFRNDGGNRNRWIRIKASGTKANRSGLGAVVTVTSKSGKQSQAVRSGSSYCSQSELALTFGLGQEGAAQAVEVVWPSGARQRFSNVAAGKSYVVDEAKGLAVVR